MHDFLTEYKKAGRIKLGFVNAKRAGWDGSGKKKRENETILVPRSEAVSLAEKLRSAMYARELYLDAMFGLKDTMGQLAIGEEGAVDCPKCGMTYRERWMGGRCPYCEAMSDAEAVMEQRLSEEDQT